MTINERINGVKRELPASCALIVVSKKRPVNQILEAYESGNRQFAENRVQNLIERHDQLPKDIFYNFFS